MQPVPISPYGVTQYVGELYAQTFGRCYGLETVSLRYFNILGSRQDPNSPYSGVPSRFAMAFLKETQPIVYGDRSLTWPWYDVHAAARLVEHPPRPAAN
jgi:nucleoside-diphosphate-sugar epimerase